jgi:hypothetical protein
MTLRRLRIATTLISLVGVVACGGSPAPTPTPTPQGIPSPSSSLVLLRNDWRAAVTMQRVDSLVLTLPDGTRQTQRLERLALFTVEIGSNNAFAVTLDSLAMRPAANQAIAAAIGTRWTGRLSGAGHVEGLRISRSTPLAEDLTTVVRSLIPPVSFSGVAVGRSWKDTTSGTVQVEVFQATERRIRSWTAGEESALNGVLVHPIRVREEFEQLGRGAQAGREMTMTAQGVRSGNYYVTLDGRVEGAVLRDSVAQFITIPATKVTVPTMRYSRLTLRFATSPSGNRP